VTGLYLFGPPGVGKTTLMRAFLDPLVPAPAIRLHRALWAEPLIDGDAYAGLLLGRTRGTFSGTDALSMAALPDACGWARAQAPLPVYGEGARLAHPKFADALRDGRNPVRWVLLDAPDDVLGKRRAERGTGQNESWVPRGHAGRDAPRGYPRRTAEGGDGWLTRRRGATARSPRAPPRPLWR
jgi:P-loop Nucleotide Kinase3